MLYRRRALTIAVGVVRSGIGHAFDKTLTSTGSNIQTLVLVSSYHSQAPTEAYYLDRCASVIGQRSGYYRVLKQLGAGMGAIYLAQDAVQDRL